MDAAGAENTITMDAAAAENTITQWMQRVQQTWMDNRCNGYSRYRKRYPMRLTTGEMHIRTIMSCNAILR